MYIKSLPYIYMASLCIFIELISSNYKDYVMCLNDEFDLVQVEFAFYLTNTAKQG